MQKKLLQSLNSFFILVHEDPKSFISKNYYMNLTFKMKISHLQSFIKYHMHKLKITHFISHSLNTPYDRKAAKSLRQRLVQKLKIAFGNQRVRPESIVVQGPIYSSDFKLLNYDMFYNSVRKSHDSATVKCFEFEFGEFEFL